MKILGISAYYHDSAAAIIVDGKVLFAAQEERFTRIKNDASFPENSIQFCLSESGFAINMLIDKTIVTLNNFAVFFLPN